MRRPILRTLLVKELLRLAGNRGALAMAGLLMTCGLLLAVLDTSSPTLGHAGGLHVFWLDYWQDGPWVEHLRANVPPAFGERVRFRHVADIPSDRNGTLQYGRSEGAVQIRSLVADGSHPRMKVWFWYAGDDPAVIVPYEEWFWRETQRFYRIQATTVLPTDRRQEAEALDAPDVSGDPAKLAQELHRLYRERLTALAPATVGAVLPEVEVERSALHGLETRQTVATGLMLFSLFFACALLLPSMTCEERERGILLAQALAPASSAHVLAAKAIVFPGLGIVLAAGAALVSMPTVWFMPFFWLTLATAAAGTFALGVIIASLAPTQRAASTGAMVYALAIAILMVVGQRCNIPSLTFVVPESHYPSLFYVAFHDVPTPYHWRSLGVAASLTGGWVGASTLLFRWRGWP